MNSQTTLVLDGEDGLLDGCAVLTRNVEFIVELRTMFSRVVFAAVVQMLLQIQDALHTRLVLLVACTILAEDVAHELLHVILVFLAILVEFVDFHDLMLQVRKHSVKRLDALLFVLFLHALFNFKEECARSELPGVLQTNFFQKLRENFLVFEFHSNNVGVFGVSVLQLVVTFPLDVV